MAPTPLANFDLLARPYAAFEYLVFGRALERRRNCFLNDPRLAKARRALVLGDGDGRFCAALLAAHPKIAVTAVDASRAMLRRLEARVHRDTPRAELEIVHADARNWRPEGEYDLVATHFFLDCFSSEEVTAIITNVSRALAPGALWLFSDFAVSERGVPALFGKGLVGALYFAHRLVIGLEVTHLPDHAAAFRALGFTLAAFETGYANTLRSELWLKTSTEKGDDLEELPR